MAKTLPHLNWFRSFEAAARRMSSTAAAEEIGLTQSAVSQQIKALETRLGVALFHRHARGLSLTDDGRKLLPQVEAALETLKNATSQYLTNSDGELITIAASISMTEWVIAPVLPEFHRRNPGTSIRFMSTIWPDEFTAPRADIEIRFGSKRQVGKDAAAIQPDELIPVKSPSLRGSLDDLPLIETVGVSDGWPSWAKSAGVAVKAPAYYADSHGLALRLAANANGVALVSSVIANGAISRGVVEMAHKCTAPASEGYFLSVRHEKEKAAAFVHWLADYLPQQERAL